MSEKQLFELQQWLSYRIKDLSLASGKRIAFDFHQIDLDVELDRLRCFGKGPSPKKKFCVNGFRPHIAWDIDNGCILAMEFRKSSARATRTVKRFVNDFLKGPFKGMFESIYIDSEYTGKDVWNFILDQKEGLGAQLVACIKKNKFVKKYLDDFLLTHKDNPDFWLYWDDTHVYSAQTFQLKWEYIYPHTEDTQTFTLQCVAKKNLKNGAVRCFASSVPDMTAKDILKAYRQRWVIENGIKDLVQSFYIDQCPGTSPHQVNIHFFIVTLCKILYQMIQKDCEPWIANPDGSKKTLQSMRERLIRQGPGQFRVKDNCIEIQFNNSYSVKTTEELDTWLSTINEKAAKGLKILGGYKLKYQLRPSYGSERKNSLEKIVWCTMENNEQPTKI